ncbi:hypothetical protein [Sutterella wadsworthensis]|uniref:hypothetical protein n=1 Tax=Sutterella wadsworthensis TaxID=40545 RepID=UPI0013F5F3A3|nr:hypothetical protein [Sutterella wadsworthensis]
MECLLRFLPLVCLYMSFEFCGRHKKKAPPIKIGRAFICLTHKKQWRRRRDSDFFSDANKIKELAFRILVKIAQGHQKGHQKIHKKLTIINNVLIKFVYRKKGRTSILPALNGAVLL